MYEELIYVHISEGTKAFPLRFIRLGGILMNQTDFMKSQSVFYGNLVRLKKALDLGLMNVRSTHGWFSYRCILILPQLPHLMIIYIHQPRGSVYRPGRSKEKKKSRCTRALALSMQKKKVGTHAGYHVRFRILSLFR